MGKEIKIALNKINWLHTFYQDSSVQEVIPFIYNEDQTKIKNLLTDEIRQISEDFVSNNSVAFVEHDKLGFYKKSYQKHTSAQMLTHYSVGIMPFVTSKTIRGLYYITEEELPRYCTTTQISRKEIAKLADIFSNNITRRIQEEKTEQKKKEEQDSHYKF